MKKFLKYIIAAGALLACAIASAQVDRRDVQRGNRDFRKGSYREAEIDYRKALIKDSASFAANYDLAGALYKENDVEQARKFYDKLSDAAKESVHAADYYFNLGDAAAKAEDWKTAVDAYKESLLRNPGDLDAKENYIYARMKLQQQQDNQNGEGGSDQNQDNNQDQKDQDQNQDQNKDQQPQDGEQNQDNRQQQQQPQPNITPQAAQQMLQAIQAKEKETQEKVNKEKAEALKSRQREKNW